MCCCSCNSTICSPTTAPEHALLHRTVFSVRRWNEHNVGWRFASVWCYRRCNYAIVFFFLLPMWISLLANWRCANYVIFHRLLFDEMKDSRFFFCLQCDLQMIQMNAESHDLLRIIPKFHRIEMRTEFRTYEMSHPSIRLVITALLEFTIPSPRSTTLRPT